MSTCRKSLFDSCPAGWRKREKPAKNFWCVPSLKNESQQGPGRMLSFPQPRGPVIAASSESHQSLLQLHFAPSPSLSLKTDAVMCFCCSFARSLHTSSVSSVRMRKVDMVRGIWKSIGKSQRYLSVYHAVPDNKNSIVSSLSPCVVIIEEASSCWARACSFSTTPGHSSRVRMSKEKGKTHNEERWHRRPASKRQRSVYHQEDGPLAPPGLPYPPP